MEMKNQLNLKEAIELLDKLNSVETKRIADLAGIIGLVCELEMDDASPEVIDMQNTYKSLEMQQLLTVLKLKQQHKLIEPKDLLVLLDPIEMKKILKILGVEKSIKIEHSASDVQPNSLEGSFGEKEVTIDLENQETKNERFMLLAESLVNSILQKLNLIENLSNRHNYHYTEGQVQELFDVIEVTLKQTKQMFESEMMKEETTFKFTEKWNQGEKI